MTAPPLTAPAPETVKPLVSTVPLKEMAKSEALNTMKVKGNTVVIPFAVYVV
ncbi:hypothetical protein [Yersinia kristensenii]|uniref:hypothetical protein n=1 Tax=Yersinia kristensenii TaxID=28152 RepID=UPI00155627A1|nr:hypothetical protein [Yersinia kristensenii]MDA5520846.1 hypothetical protein [Yersinia kristensenii]